MEKKVLALPQKKYEYGYELAYQIAREQLAGCNISEQCQRCGARYLEPGRVEMTYLGQACLINLPEATVSFLAENREAPIRDTLLILHYLLRARGTPLAGRLVTYRELKEGNIYAPTFYKRTIAPLVRHFGKEPQRLAETARVLGGKAAGYGDGSATVTVLPRVPVTLVLWRGDEEFPPEGNVLLDTTVTDYLTHDDIHTLCEILVWKLVSLVKTGGDNPGKK